jgi:type II secretory pathway pseudopilin PulG
MFRAMLKHTRARLDGEGGFTIIEAVVSITLLALGGYAVAQSMILGLSTTGASRERIAARSIIDQQMELARALNYDSLVLDDASGIPHSTDPNSPDYWVDQTNQTYDHDGSGSDAPEGIVRVAGASPALHHLQTPITQGNTTFDIYVYITWVDSPSDGLGAADQADGNGDGESDANGHDAKRVTVVTEWNDSVRAGAPRQLSVSSLFSVGQIFYQGDSSGGSANQPPTVGCPTSSVSGLTVDFVATATDSDGTITNVTWDFGDSATGTGTSVSHTYASAGTYTIVNTATDDGGLTATNAGQNCTVTTTAPSAGPGPEGTVTIAAGAAYTTQLQVTLTLTLDIPGSATTMQFSTDNSTWSTPIAYNTSTILTLASGDGTKTVYARFIDSTGTAGGSASDTIILDTTAPDAPTNLTAGSTTSGSTKTVSLSWSAPIPLPVDLAGYQVWQRLTTGSTWAQVATCTSGTSCTDSFKKQDSYEYYVVAVDNAGNISAQSNHVTK